MKNKITIFSVLFLLSTVEMFSQDTTYVSGCVGDSIHFHSGLKYYSSYSWDFDNNAVSSEEYPVIIFLQPGNYAVTVSAYDACCPNHDTTQFLFLSIYNDINCELNHSDSIISITPNPVSSVMSVEYFIYQSYNASLLEIRLMELNTATIRKSVPILATDNSVFIDISDIPSGIYSVGLYINGNLMNQKQAIIN